MVMSRELGITARRPHCDPSRASGWGCMSTCASEGDSGRSGRKGCPSLLNTGVSVVPNTPTDSPREVSSVRSTNNCHVPLQHRGPG